MQINHNYKLILMFLEKDTEIDAELSEQVS